jgi:general secretion pathway protein F
MRTFHYRGYSADGSVRQGYVEAEGAKPALRSLAAEGVFVERLGPVQVRAGLTAARRSMLYRELAALLTAGLPLERALSLLIGAGGSGHDAAAALAPVRDAVREGQPLAAALAASDPRMASFERAAVTAAERTATLPTMLLRVAEFIESRSAVIERLRSAAIYPSFVLALGLGVAILMLGVLVPKAQAALAAGGVVLPAASLAVVSVARGVAWTAGALVALTLVAVVAVSALCRRDEAWRVRMDRWRLRLPWAGRVAGKLAAARFASTLAVLARAGVPLVDGIALAGEATGNRWLAAWVGREAERVRHGHALSEAIASITPMAGSLAEWVRVGEAGGCLDTMLDVAAQRAQSSWERSVSRVLALFEPVVLVCVGVFVLAVALAVLLPVTALTRSIG